jgi:hypothetical protein
MLTIIIKIKKYQKYNILIHQPQNHHGKATVAKQLRLDILETASPSFAELALPPGRPRKALMKTGFRQSIG